MALVSPGVQVTVIDQSQYLPAASNSVPLVILATAQDKADATGTSVAEATTKSNATNYIKSQASVTSSIYSVVHSSIRQLMEHLFKVTNLMSTAYLLLTH